MNDILFDPSTPEYQENNNSYFTSFNNDLAPSKIAQPRTAEQVARLIRDIAQSDSKIAIRGGGYTPWKGAANIDGGITIDLRKLRGIVLSKDKTVVSIAAGERWGDVYQELEGCGLAVVGGRVSNVGVVGLTIRGKHISDESCT